MLQDPNVERYIEIAVKPLKKEIEQMKAQIEALSQALRIHDVVGRSEQLKAFAEFCDKEGYMFIPSWLIDTYEKSL
jgi:prefoldin subunit 5